MVSTAPVRCRGPWAGRGRAVRPPSTAPTGTG